MNHPRPTEITDTIVSYRVLTPDNASDGALYIRSNSGTDSTEAALRLLRKDIVGNDEKFEVKAIDYRTWCRRYEEFFA